MRFLRVALPLLVWALAGTGQAHAVELGKDLAGEACAVAGPVSLAHPAVITCDGISAGTLQLVDLMAPTGMARAAALAAAARTAVPDATCGAPAALDGDTLLLSCTAGAMAWPRLVLVKYAVRGVFVADGLPAMADILARAVANESGTSTPALADTVRQQFAARLVEAGAGDYSRYAGQAELAQQRSAAGNYAGAEAAYRTLLDMETRLFGSDSPAGAQTTLELALQVSNQERFDEAGALFRQATPAINAMPTSGTRARLASYLAMDAANRRDYVDGLKFARQATAARRADVSAAKAVSASFGGAPVASVEQEAELARALQIDAEMAMRLGDYPAAEAAAQEALYIIAAQPGIPLSWRSDIVLLMGELNAQLGSVATAEHDLLQAVEMDRKLFSGTGATATAELELAKFYSDQQLYPAALDNYRKAFADLRSDPAVHPRLVADQVVPFFKAAIAAGGSGNGELTQEIYAASQLVESGVEGQTIARVAARQAIDDPALQKELLDSEAAERKLAAARVSLAVERTTAASDRDPGREKLLIADLDAAQAQDEAAAAKLQKDFPRYARLSSPQPVSLEILRKHLRPREGFVSFVIGARGSFVLLVTRDGLTARPVEATRDSLATDIADLRGSLSSGPDQLPFSLKNAYGLYRQLLGPVDKELAGLDHLVIAAGGDLASLPFALLVSADPQEDPSYTDAAWLVRRAAIAQVPSASAFLALRTATHAPAPRPLLGLGDPAFAGGAQAGGLVALSTTCQQGGPVNAALLRALPPLPDTADELRRVAMDLKAGPDDLLLGVGATEAALRQRPLDQYAVLYFATHGLLPGELHCQAEPALVLSPPDGGGGTAGTDGLLTASEIADLKLNADLVVLSACNTAAAGGTAFGGGALDGLADAFFEAGARAVLASHWKVSSAATAQLMALVFANLAADPSRDIANALRQAQLAMLAAPATAHPFNWAAFTLIGAGAAEEGS